MWLLWLSVYLSLSTACLSCFLAVGCESLSCAVGTSLVLEIGIAIGPTHCLWPNLSFYSLCGTLCSANIFGVNQNQFMGFFFMDHAFCFISVYLLSTPKSQLSSSFLSVRLILASSSLWIIICVRVYLLFSCGYSLPPQLHFLCGEVFNYMPCLVSVFPLFFLWDSLLLKKYHYINLSVLWVWVLTCLHIHAPG